MDKNHDELMTVSEVAEFLKVPKSWVYARTRMKSIPLIKVGRLCRIPRRELLEALHDGRLGDHARSPGGDRAASN